VRGAPRPSGDGSRAARALLCLLATGLWACEGATPAADLASAPGPAATSAAAPFPAGTAPAQPTPPPITSFPVLDLDAAVLAAAESLLTNATAAGAAAASPVRRPLTIDPLIDASTGQQLQATRSMQARIGELVRTRHPAFDLQPFTAVTLAAAPLVLIGTLTTIDAEGQPSAVADSYRVWLTLADLRSGTIVAKARARARSASVDATPMPSFRDAPVWAEDDATAAYVATCHGGKVGGPIPPAYLDRLLAAALTNDAIEAYDAGRYQEALETYAAAHSIAAGDQLRVLNGLYLANWKLGRHADAAAAFGDIVDYGIRQHRLAVKFLFRPGSTAFWPDPEVSGPYPVWLRQIALRTSARDDVCVEITGHTSRTGPEPLNERLSLLRAEAIGRRLQAEAPTLAPRIITDGRGSRETLVGTGTDDAIDALDRRVEFRLPPC